MLAQWAPEQQRHSAANERMEKHQFAAGRLPRRSLLSDHAGVLFNSSLHTSSDFVFITASSVVARIASPESCLLHCGLAIPLWSSLRIMPSFGVDLSFHSSRKFLEGASLEKPPTWLEDAASIAGKVGTRSTCQLWMISRLVFLGAASSVV